MIDVNQNPALDPALETAIRNAWSATTAAGDNRWTTANPAAGHCDVTSLVIRERVGGDLCLTQVFRDGVLSEHHYWNVLPAGVELDLTAEQFDGSETFGPVTTMTAEFFENAGPMQAELLRRLELFRSSVDRQLEPAQPSTVGE